MRRVGSWFAMMYVSTALAQPVYAAAEATCPRGKWLYVSHLGDGRSEQVRVELEKWVATLSDLEHASRARAAVDGKICLKDAALLESLISLTEADSVELRIVGLHVVSRVGGPMAERAARERLDDKSSRVRLEALAAMQYACDKSATVKVGALSENDPDPEVKRYAGIVVARLKGPNACTPLPAMW